MTAGQLAAPARATPQASRPRRVPAVSPAAWLTVASMGLLLIVVGYVMGRDGTSGSLVPYWGGQALLFVSLAACAVTWRGWTTSSGTVLALVVGVLSYAIKWLYSPVQLKFIDEMQHERNITNALQSGHLGGTNYALQISEHYPGLQAVGSALASMTGLSAGACGLIVAGLLHVATVVGVFALIALVSHSARAGAIGVVVFSANGGFEFFGSFYIYENLAFPFALLAVIFAFQASVAAERGRVLAWSGAAFLAGCVVIISHHVTAIYIVGVLAVAAVVSLVTRPTYRRRLVALAVATAAATALWMGLYAHGTLAYLEPYTVHANRGGTVIVTSTPKTGVSVPAEPAAGLFVSRAGLVVLGLLILGGLVQLVRRRDYRDPWRVMLSLLALGMPLVTEGSTFLVSGASGAGRSEPFLFVGVAYVVGSLLADPPPLRLRAHRQRSVPSAAWVVLLAFIVLGGVSRGWPAWWEKTPRGYVPRGYESAVDTRSIAAAEWVQHHVAAGTRFAADANASQLLTTVGDVRADTGAGTVFYSDTPDQARIALAIGSAQYVWVDTRMTSVPSPSGTYLASSAGRVYDYPPTASELNRFSQLPGAAEVYDDGVISIWDVRHVDLRTVGRSGS